MSEKIPRPLLFTLSFALCLILYWPALHGTPIWDDGSFWFKDPVMSPEFSYLTIWKDFAWPLSVSLQKLLLQWWSDNYLYYHLLNLVLHFLNSVLVYQLGKELKIKHPFLLFLLFLLHPSCVISVGWMIQLKTLLCMFFALISVLSFIRGTVNKRWYLVSLGCFTLSLMAKSASLPLPIILSFFLLPKDKRGQLIIVIPFFIISALFSFRVLGSSATLSAIKSAASTTAIKITATPQTEVVGHENETIITPPPIEESTETTSSVEILNLSPTLITKTFHYYFWQVLLPLNNEPVKGNNAAPLGPVEMIHLIFLMLILLSLRKDPALYWLLAGHVLLLPFIGLIPAPYMNITWVSDQHLYLALPAFIGFWLILLEKLKWKYVFVISTIFFMIFFSSKTKTASHFYQGELAFYEESLRANPTNVPIVYNLAIAYLSRNHWSDAFHLLSNTIGLAREEAQMKESPYWSYIFLLHQQMQTISRP